MSDDDMRRRSWSCACGDTITIGDMRSGEKILTGMIVTMAENGLCEWTIMTLDTGFQIKITRKKKRSKK